MIFIKTIKIMNNDSNDNVRAFDAPIRDQLINNRSNLSVSQNFSQNTENDPEMMMAIEESLRMYEKNVEMNKQVEKLQQNQSQKAEKEKAEEELRVENLRKKLGIIISRLKSISSTDSVAEDLLTWINWECTPTHLLTSFRPPTKNSLYEMKNWIQKNLNPSMQKLLEEQNFF